MKYCFIILLIATHSVNAQKWQAEIMAGIAGYSGDLTQRVVSPKTFQPAAGINIKYDFGDVFVIRGGLAWAKLKADDKHNQREELRNRNLNFETSVLEGSVCLEVNIFEPEFFNVYPYVFAGLGLFHFNPYTYDDQQMKHYLQPLGTEGQGLAAYPGRKPYKLTQFCMPVGGGMKIKVAAKWDLVYEFGARILFTDYLDDVSKTYVSTHAFFANSRPKAAELAYRERAAGIPNEGDIRGNPSNKDVYFISGFKLLLQLGKD